MYNEETKTQYCIMTEENKNIANSYVPDWDKMINECPDEQMKEKWIECKERHSRMENPKWQGFAFNAIYMMEMKCGHFELFQHHVRSEDELVEWIKLMQEPKNYHKCTICICGN